MQSDALNEFHKFEMIYTSYFGNVKKILEEVPDAGLISIAGKTPTWFKGEKFKPLMSHYDWWKECIYVSK